jgi:cobalamin biosynthesis Mg chelatase CobN
VEFRVGLGLYWHGAAVVGGVDFGLGFGAFVFVGTDHFWGGNYRVYAFDERRSRDFFVHSEFHAGYRVEGGHLMAEGLGRDHMKEITHHEVVVAKASEMRQKEEHQNFAKRTEQHHELARVTVHKPEAARQEASRTAATRERTTGSTPERTSATTGRPGTETAASPGTAGHPAAATSSTRTSTGYPGATTGRPGTSAYSPGGASSAAGHSKTNSTSSKSSAPSTQKKPE